MALLQHDIKAADQHTSQSLENQQQLQECLSHIAV
jgi:hypothetical protein